MIEKVGKPEAVAADAAYKTPAITNYLFGKEITPALPTGHEQKKGSFASMTMLTLNILIVISAHQARFLSQCTESKDHQKVVTRHIWQNYMEEADYLRHHKDVKPIYAKRKETIERVFADAKEKHGMRWTTLRGLKKLSMQVMLTFAAMNVKKMANWTWEGLRIA